MAQELPYFRFVVQEWQNGDISLEDYELQGLFISICGFYWIHDCSIAKALLEKKYKDAKAGIEQLINLNILKYEESTDKIHISFLNEQFDMLSQKRISRQSAGSKGGIARVAMLRQNSSNATAMLKQTRSYKDKIIEDKIIEDKIESHLFFKNEKFVLMWDEWLKVKKKKRGSMADAILKRQFDKMEKWAGGNLETAIAIVERSATSGWADLFELKKESNGKEAAKQFERIPTV